MQEVSIFGKKNSGLGLEVGVAWALPTGQTYRGDCHVFQEFPGGALLGVVDVVGCGQGAVSVATRVLDVLKQRAGQPIPSLVQRCHQELLGTRGAVMALASLEPAKDTVTWLAVGSVDGVLLCGQDRGKSGCQSLVQHFGLVGWKLPTLRVSPLRLSPGDTLIVVTNGIRPDFRQDLEIRPSAQKTAEFIVSRHARPTDEALALVARYLGSHDLQ